MHFESTPPAFFCADCPAFVSPFSPPELYPSTILPHFKCCFYFVCFTFPVNTHILLLEGWRHEKIPINRHEDTQMNQWHTDFSALIRSSRTKYPRLLNIPHIRCKMCSISNGIQDQSSAMNIIFQDWQNISIYSISNCITLHLFIQDDL